MCDLIDPWGEILLLLLLLTGKQGHLQSSSLKFVPCSAGQIADVIEALMLKRSPNTWIFYSSSD